MKADRKITGMWREALCVLIGASALLTGCTSDDDGLREGEYMVTSVDLGNCSNDNWLKSSTTASSLMVVADGDQFVVKACTQGDCAPSSPSSYVWDVDAWRGQDGGAYLVENGCMVTYVNATANVVAGQLVIESTRWVSQLPGGSCTYDEVLAMGDGTCDSRTRLTATER
jgi:hypothetical protein